MLMKPSTANSKPTGLSPELEGEAWGYPSKCVAVISCSRQGQSAPTEGWDAAVCCWSLMNWHSSFLDLGLLPQDLWENKQRLVGKRECINTTTPSSDDRGWCFLLISTGLRLSIEELNCWLRLWFAEGIGWLPPQVHGLIYFLHYNPNQEIMLMCNCATYPVGNGAWHQSIFFHEIIRSAPFFGHSFMVDLYLVEGYETSGLE